MTLIGITGAIGGGKTVLMTRFAYKEYLKNKIKIDDGTIEIVTNYKLNGIPFRYIKADELFNIKSSLKNARLFIDEMHMFMDSRSSFNKNVKQLTHFILQTRHLGVHLYFTTQDIGQVDIRLRRQLDILAYCSQTQYQDFFRVKTVDYRDVLNIRKTEFVYCARPYYNLYDTTEIIDITDKDRDIIKKPSTTKIKIKKPEIKIYPSFTT